MLAWISNYNHYKIWVWITSSHTLHWMSMLGFKLIHDSKRGQRCEEPNLLKLNSREPHLHQSQAVPLIIKYVLAFCSPSGPHFLHSDGDTFQTHRLRPWIYSISQEICTRFCCALLCCGYAIVHNEFTWSIYPYSSGLLCWHWGNR